LGSGFRYVDINNNQAYDAMMDIIVDGAPTGGTHLVYRTDLRGQRRFRSLGIDRGAYEAPPVGTIIWIK
jgi:hypothetical protein